MVTAATTPSGTLATSTPMAMIKFVSTPYPLINPRMKKAIASVKAMIEMYLMNRWISLFKVEDPLPALEASEAIYPMTVLSPVSKTTPTPWPVVH